MRKRAVIIVLCTLATVGIVGTCKYAMRNTVDTRTALPIVFQCAASVRADESAPSPFYKHIGNALAVTWISDDFIFELKGKEHAIVDADQSCSGFLLCATNTQAYKCDIVRWNAIPAAAIEAKHWSDFESVRSWISPGEDRKTINLRGKSIHGPGRAVINFWLDKTETYIAAIWSESRPRQSWDFTPDFTNKPPPIWYGPFVVQLLSAADGSAIGPAYNIGSANERRGILRMNGGWTKDSSWLVFNESWGTRAWIFARTPDGLVPITEAQAGTYSSEPELPECWRDQLSPTPPDPTP